MQVDLNELLYIKQNTPNGMYSIVAGRLKEKGFNVTRFTVANEVNGIKESYKAEIINEVREVFTLLTGLTYNGTAALQ